MSLECILLTTIRAKIGLFFQKTDLLMQLASIVDKKKDIYAFDEYSADRG